MRISSTTRSLCVVWAWLVLVLREYEAEHVDCPPACVCSAGLQLEYDCAAGSGRVELLLQPREYLRVTCTGLHTLPADLPALPGLGDAILPSVSFTDCPLPVNGSWADVLRSLGLNGTRSLKLTSRLGSTTMPLSRKHLTNLPELSSLWLESFAPDHLPHDLLADLPALRRITLRGAPTNLDADAFVSAPLLERLEIAMTNLTEVPAYAFRGLPLLRRLGLWGSGVTTVDKEAFSGLNMLQDLDLSSNAMRSLSPGTLGAAAGLERVWLNGNPLEELEDGAFAGLVNLKEVGVWDSHSVLSLGARALASLPALVSIRMERCSMRSVPDTMLVGSAALTNLSLAGNKLQALPPTLLRDQLHLLHLDLSRNEIMKLDPDFFTPLRRLLSLELSRNQIEELPELVFSSLSSVQHVSLERNRLHHVAEDAFNGARDLRNLVLSRNNLTLRLPAAPASLEQDAYVGFGFGASSPFSSLQRLRRLDLSYNRIADVFTDWRLLLLALQHLDLSHNAIQLLTESDLNFLGEIVVDLRHNNITTIQLPDPSVIAALTADGSPSAARLLIDDNPFMCDCRLYQLAGRLATRSPPSEPTLEANDARCASPPALAGLALLAVPSTELTCPLLPPACPLSCICTQRPGAALLELTCKEPPANSTWPDPMDLGLSATSLRLNSLPPRGLDEMAMLPSHVTELRLSGLNLRTLTGTIPPTLQLLDLSDNKLSTLPPMLLAHNNNTRLLLAGNPFACDCDHVDAIILIQSWKTQVADWETAQCVSEAGAERLAAVRADWLCSARRQLAALLALAAGVALLAVLGAALCRRYELELRVWLAARGLLCCRRVDPLDLADRHKRYDAFVSYSHLDEEWVLSQLVPRLEPALRLCVHFRDWVAGEFIPTQIARSVEESRRTIVVLSDNFLSSVWGRLEWRAAHVRALREGRARVVVLVLGQLDTARLDPELRAYLATNTYVKVGDPWFWDKLQYALPRPAKTPLEDSGRDVARRKGFDDRLAPAPALHSSAPQALQVQLTADGQLVNAPDKFI